MRNTASERLGRNGKGLFFTDTNVGKGIGIEPQRERLERNRMKENLAEDDPASFGRRL
jgi:hypothetical protein